MDKSEVVDKSEIMEKSEVMFDEHLKNNIVNKTDLSSTSINDEQQQLFTEMVCFEILNAYQFNIF